MNYTLERDNRELQQGKPKLIVGNNYTLERDNRELQRISAAPALSLNYTLERDNRELQLKEEDPLAGKIIPLREIIGNYNLIRRL